MPSTPSKRQRAILALPFLGLALLCLQVMDIEKMVAHQEPFLRSRKIKWSNGSIPILSHFHYAEFLNELWRGTTVSFSPSTLGYDVVSSWQMFSFLNDLGPTIFAFAGQLLGLGSVAPLFYFLCFTFGPSTSALIQLPLKMRLAPEHNVTLLPILLLLHTCEVFAAYLAPQPTTRHYWTWAWQMSPLWVGIANFVISKLIGTSPSFRATTIKWLTSPKLLLSLMSIISAGVWVYMLVNCPYPLSTVFIPSSSAQSKFVPHMRRALQYDEIAVFGTSFLWLGYLFFDLHCAGLIRRGEWLVPVAALPIFTAFVGPGAAFAFGWYWRESKLQSKLAQE
ncbi:conserved hypothetical protein [Histoplasma capsulatum var. duboisii H88]|uniref:Uncharacterized protein n=2 Tax=Ajellomyces capsulatus (strain H88) TaxID=544711 RepID=F0UG93_AJEC8|nr:conserved hypothetical protein [Histoplasma capsulatum var. duboisii H88]